MGSWNGTCAVSNLHVTAGEEVVVFMLLENKRHKTFCYGNALYDVCPIPFYGKYNDYGAVEECHGFGLNIVIEALRAKLYRFGQGPNSAHDCEVNKENFNIDKLFEADLENRLGIEHIYHYNQDSYDLRKLRDKHDEEGLTESQQFELDRLAAKIKQEDNFRRVTHVIVHGDIFRTIIDKWYIKDYVGEGEGNQGYDNNYVHIYFKDLKDSIPEYIRRTRESYEKTKLEVLTLFSVDKLSALALRRIIRSICDETFSWDDPCLAGRWMESYRTGSSSSVWALINVQEYVSEYIEKEDWAGLESFVTEVLTTAWIDSFMSYTRKIWTKQTGLGSQSNEPIGYKILAEGILDILKAEQAEREEWEEDVAASISSV